MSMLKNVLMVGGGMAVGATLAYVFRDNVGEVMEKMPWAEKAGEVADTAAQTINDTAETMAENIVS